MADNSTRSGLLWEVERILTELKELEKEGKGKMVNVLIMENVPQIHSEQDLPHFVKWINRLEELGYQSYWEDLIATDYGIPQSRNRCFMVSIYGDYTYTFPKAKPLKLRLKDLLEKNVDERFYISEEQIKDIQGWNAYEKPLEKMEQTDKSQVSPTLTTRSGAYAAGMILVKEPKVLADIGEKDSNGGTQWKQQNRIYDNDIAMSITASFPPYYIEDKITIPLKRGYDCEVKKEQDDTTEIDVIGNYSKSNFTQTSIVGKNGVAPTFTENHGETTAILTDDYRVRRLTPRTSLRLMGVKDKDITNLMKHQSVAQGLHIAGDSIVVNVLMALFSKLLDLDWEDYFKPEEWWNNE